MFHRWISKWLAWASAVRTPRWVLARPPAQQQDGLEAPRVRRSAHSCGSEHCTASFIQNYHLTFLAKMHLVPLFVHVHNFFSPFVHIKNYLIDRVGLYWLNLMWWKTGWKTILCPGQHCSYFPWLHKPHYLRSCSVNLHNQFYSQ